MASGVLLRSPGAMSIKSYIYLSENATTALLDAAKANATQTRSSKGASDWSQEVVRAPDLNDLWAQLRWVWHLHIYGMACLFLALACASFFTILRLRAQLSSRPYLSTLNVFLCLLGMARALALFIDPYGTKKAISLVINRIIWDLGYPCLLSAFALLQLSFLRMSKMKIMIPSSRLSGETAATVIITSHFCLIILSDVLWVVRKFFWIMWLLTQVVFVLWGLFLCLTFLCGCLRLLRSVAELPLQVLSQVEPGYDSKAFVPLGLVLPHNGHHNNNRLASSSQSQASASIHPTTPGPSTSAQSRFGPKIRITDVNEQTYSYASDGSPAAFSEQRTPEGDTLPTPALRSTPNQWPNPRRNPNICEDPALIRPLMGDQSSSALKSPLSDDEITRNPAIQEMRRNGPATITSLNPGRSQGQRTTRVLASPLEEFTFDARKLKTKHSTRLEKLLRTLLVTSVLGTFLCLLRAYDIFGPHGLSSSQGKETAVIPWFLYQTIIRIVEFSMACSMARISRQSLHNHSYHYCEAAKKHRDPFCYMNN